jgi:hypothetical protein
MTSSFGPGSIMGGTVAGAFDVPSSALQGQDVVFAYALFNFVDDGDVTLLSSAVTGSPFGVTITNSYWNDLEQVQATLGGGESGHAQSQFFSVTNQYVAAFSIPCGAGCSVPFSQTIQDKLEGYTGFFSVLVPLGPPSLALLSTGTLPFTLQFSGDAIFVSDSLVIERQAIELTSAPEPGATLLFALGVVVSGTSLRRRRANVTVERDAQE